MCNRGCNHMSQPPGAHEARRAACPRTVTPHHLRHLGCLTMTYYDSPAHGETGGEPQARAVRLALAAAVDTPVTICICNRGGNHV